MEHRAVSIPRRVLIKTIYYMEPLITATIGLGKIAGKYYLQVITPHEDEGKANGNYLISIEQQVAEHISRYDGIGIDTLSIISEVAPKYTLSKVPSGAHHFKYTVKDETGKVMTERKSARDYVACTIDGRFYFGRLDLIGKGEHGQQVKWQDEHGKDRTPIAYLEQQ